MSPYRNQLEEDKKAELIGEMRFLKAENSEIHNRLASLDKVTNRNHEKIVSSKVYIRELKNKIIDHQKRQPGRMPGTPKHGNTPGKRSRADGLYKSAGKDYRNIGEEDVVAMEAKLQDLKMERVEHEKNHYRTLKELEREKEMLMYENARFDFRGGWG